MGDVNVILDLPMMTLAALAGGYLGYRMAYVGNDQTHQAGDVVFLSLCFALMAKLVMAAIPEKVSDPLTASFGVASALAVAAVWRRWGARTWADALRDAGVVTSDRHHSVMQTITSREGHAPSQLTVRLKDGSAIMCERLADFKRAPFGPCLLGPDGSIAIYVTDYRPAGDTEWSHNQQDASEWGFALTVIAASEIADFEIRYSV